MKKYQKGFTLIELMIVIFFVGVVGILLCYCTLGAGNFWCTESGVERQLKAEHPEINEVVTINRGVWGYSRVLAKTKDGASQTYCLDSNILFNYEFDDCSK